jgi:MinD-like ATPase involved in chromosome partitioning or flagellar assembly
MRTTSGSCCMAVMAELSVSLALVGGDPRLARAVAAAVEGAGSHALLPPSAADRAAVLLVADDASGAGLDRLRAEVLRRPERPTLLVAGESGVDAQAAMAAGARGVLEQPVTASDLREALARAAAFIRTDGGAVRGGPVVVLLGAAGGAGTTTCAVALAAGLPGAVLLDLDLAAGDAAAVAGARVAEPDALLTLATTPAGAAGGIATRLATGGCCPVLPAPALPEQADLVDEVGIARVLDARGAAGATIIVDAGQRIGVETVPALERADVVLIVAAPGAPGATGAARQAGLLSRLGLSSPGGVVRCRAGRGPTAGSPPFAVVHERRQVADARERGVAPPPAPFAPLVNAVEEALT